MVQTIKEYVDFLFFCRKTILKEIEDPKIKNKFTVSHNRTWLIYKVKIGKKISLNK